jgi:hypothetical protein
MGKLTVLRTGKVYDCLEEMLEDQHDTMQICVNKNKRILWHSVYCTDCLYPISFFQRMRKG